MSRQAVRVRSSALRFVPICRRNLKHKGASVPRPRLTYRNTLKRHSWSNEDVRTGQIAFDAPALYLDVPMITSFVATSRDSIALPASSADGEVTVASPELPASRPAC